jgi:hypothetical protein
MAKYYFDLCDDGAVAVDKEGMELSSLAAVQAEAAQALADFLREAAHEPQQNGSALRMAVEVRDNKGPVLRVGYIFRRRN